LGGGELSEKMKPCVYCGSEDLEVVYDPGLAIACLDCGHIGPTCFYSEDMDEETRNGIAIEAWNRRAPVKCKPYFETSRGGIIPFRYVIFVDIREGRVGFQFLGGDDVFLWFERDVDGNAFTAAYKAWLEASEVEA
jgi:hypothetical protein